ncbi:MAG: NAD(P)-dependent oxidoreductase [Burkholderiaceae bacterium]
MTILITGAGLIGTETARLLAGRGVPVVLADIREPDAGASQLAHVSFETLDVRDTAAVGDLVKRCGADRLVHTAAVLSNGMRADPINGLRVNLMGTANVLHAARHAGVKRVVTISSTTVLYSGFGSLGTDEIPEDARLHLVTDRPRSLYAMTKLANEYMGHLFRDLYGVSHVALRFAAVLGGHAKTQSSVPGQMFELLVAAAKSGDTLDLDNPLYQWGGTEEFVDLRDCARAIICALDAPAPALGVYNIAHPKLWTLAQAVAEVARVHGAFECRLPKNLTSGFAGFPHMRPAASCTAAAKSELGFSCAHALGDTLFHWW